MTRKAVPAPFLTKTYELVEDLATEEVVSWNENGTGFVVWKTADFAKDLLPKYFKHDNFSSFIRQLNTYGFRKVVPDKWEFANENFRRGHKELLSEIRRRKAALPAAGKAAYGTPPSHSHSGDDVVSTSSSSRGSDTTRAAVLSDENEKLRRENAVLSSKLAQTKKQCDDLIVFLREHPKLCPNQIDCIIGSKTQGGCTAAEIARSDRPFDDDENDESCENVVGNLKLFGVWLKEEKRKRGRDEKFGGRDDHPKAVKKLDFGATALKSEGPISA